MVAIMSRELIDFYREIEDSSQRMLEAARSDDWESVARCEGHCAVLIEQLRFQSAQAGLDAVEKAEKTKIMLRILHNDAQIRLLAEPRLEDLVQGAPRYLH